MINFIARKVSIQFSFHMRFGWARPEAGLTLEIRMQAPRWHHQRPSTSWIIRWRRPMPKLLPTPMLCTEHDTRCCVLPSKLSRWPQVQTLTSFLSSSQLNNDLDGRGQRLGWPCRRWRSNPSGECSQERLTRGTIERRALIPLGLTPRYTPKERMQFGVPVAL